VFVDKHGNGYLVEQVREVGVSLDGMVGKGIRVLSSWVGFSCLVVRAWLLLVLFLLVGLSCPLRCLSFSFFSWCAWWHRFLRWSSCLVLLGSFSAWFFLLGLVLLPFVLFSGSFLALRCPCALVCGLLPCSSWVLLWLVFFLVFRFPRISIASLGFPSFRLVRFLSGWCFSCPSCRGVLVCFLVLLRVALPFPGRCLVSQGLKQVCSGRKLGMANVCPVSSYPLVLGCPALGSVLLWLGNGASLVWFSSLRSLVLRWHGNPAFLVVGGWWRKACCRLAMVVGSAWLVCPSFFLGLM